MALQIPQQNTICGLKRKRQGNSSMFSNIDWLDQVVADVSTAKPFHEAATPAVAVEEKVKVEPCLQGFFINMLQSRGYPATTYASLACGYNNKPTQHQVSSYGIAFTDAIRSSNYQKVKQFLFSHHLHPNACNKFGESVVHAVCRRGNHSILALLLEAGCSVQVCDDFGRTPLHDACWTSQPNFELISMLLDKDPWLLSLKDRRGTTPLGYVKYDSHCKLWMEYLKEVSDKYWPCVKDDISLPDLKISSMPRIPPLASLEPNSRPIPEPEVQSSLEVLERVANGLNPDDDGKGHQERPSGLIKRITHDPAKVKGLFPASSCGQL
ncbi:hypothetical protein ACHAXN_012719 [Cyclotella atomus]